MTPEAVISSYRRALDQHLTVRRYAGTGSNRAHFDVGVAGDVTGYQPHELVPGSVIQQGDRKVLLLVEHLIDRQFALPVTTADKVVVRGRELAIIAVDDSTRRIGDTLIAYELQCRG